MRPAWRSALLLCVTGLLTAATLDPLGPLGRPEDADPFDLTVTGISAGTLGQRVLVTASFAGSSLFAAPVVVYDGSSSTAIIRLFPLHDANGTDILTVTVAADDGSSGGSPTDRINRSATIELEPVNDPPTVVTPSVVRINEDETDPAKLTLDLWGISFGPANEAGQELYLYATSLWPDQLEIVSLDYTQGASTAKLKFRPLPNFSGFAVLVVTVVEGGGGYFPWEHNVFSVEFPVYIWPVEDKPTITRKRDLIPTPGNVVAITRDDLRMEDVDRDWPHTLVFALVGEPAGDLLRDGTALAPGGTFTQEDIDNGRLSYRHGNTGTETVSLTYTDGTSACPVPLGPITVYATPLGLTRPEVVLASATSTYTEGGAAAGLDASVQDAYTGIFLGGRLDVALTAGTRAGDRLTLLDQGGGPGQVHVDAADGRVEVGSQEVGTCTISADGLSLSVSFATVAATPATATAVLRAVRFASSSQDPGSQTRSVQVVVDNGTTAASDPAVIAMQVVPVDDPPAVTSTWVATLPGIAASWTLEAADPDSAILTWGIVTQPAQGLVTLLDAPAGRFLVTATRSGTFQVSVADATTTATASISLELADPADVHPLPASDPPHEAFAGTSLEHVLAFDQVSGSLTLLLTGDAPAGTTVRAVGASGGILSWNVPANEPTGTFRRFGVLAVDQASHHLGHWPLTLLIHPDPAGDL